MHSLFWAQPAYFLLVVYFPVQEFTALNAREDMPATPSVSVARVRLPGFTSMITTPCCDLQCGGRSSPGLTVLSTDGVGIPLMPGGNLRSVLGAALRVVPPQPELCKAFTTESPRRSYSCNTAEPARSTGAAGSHPFSG